MWEFPQVRRSIYDYSILGSTLVPLFRATTNFRPEVSLAPGVEANFGQMKCLKAADFNQAPLYIWYDYFSCPQGQSPHAAKNRELAITCIPYYVAQCVFFVILCPSVQNLSHSTWRARGHGALIIESAEISRDHTGFCL